MRLYQRTKKISRDIGVHGHIRALYLANLNVRACKNKKDDLMMLKVEKIDKTYGKKRVLNGITFVAGQQVIGILGPNGAGKTTLLRIIAGITSSSGGKIIFENKDGKPIPDKHIRIGYLPQDFGLIRSYTLYEHMEYFACIKGMEKEKWKDNINCMLDMVHLSDKKDQKCGKLSGGMVRRAGIAQAFLGDPSIILLDEPATGLDLEERIRFQNLVNGFRNKCTMIISTHILDDVAKTCDNLLVANNGEVLYYGAAAGLIEMAEGRIYAMTEREAAHWQEYGINMKNYCKEEKNMVRFLYLKEGSYDNTKAEKVEPEVEDGYMYLLKKSEMKNEIAQ